MKPRRVITAASLRARCTVCAGRGRTVLVAGVNPLTGGTAGTTRCLHCADHVPVAHLPMRADSPRDT